MSEKTGIEWCDRTASPWYGCQHVSPACDHCYAESWAKRSGMVGWGPAEDRRRSVSYQKQMQKWNREAEANGVRLKVFASLCDPLDNAVSPEWFVDYLDTIRTTPSLDHLLLTKRIGNWRKRLQEAASYRLAVILADASDPRLDGIWQFIKAWLDGHAPTNAWLGSTVIDQPEADRDVPKLLAVPARVRFLSIEPMLGPVALDNIKYRAGNDGWLSAFNDGAWPELGRVHWVICGGESGPHARPMHPEWVRGLRDQCTAAGVPFHFKQWGEWAPGNGRAGGDLYERDRTKIESGFFTYANAWETGGPNPFRQTMDRIGKKAAGRLLDGVEHNGFPEVCS